MAYGSEEGYTSMNGGVAAISVDTGKVLDIEVMSSYCPSCKRLQTMPRTLNMSRQKPTTYVSVISGLFIKNEIVGLPEYFFDLKKTTD
ncbi:hypothetical protein TNCV_112181 [Trichonephila clavipes]|nr:hypothetical protein TNCV_112181 [Trichonephila clavipes]